MTLSAATIGPEELVDRLERRPAVHTEVPFRGRVWDVRRDTVDLGEAGQVVRDYVEHPGAVAVVALREDRRREEVLVLRQYRHPVAALEWELPAGLLDVAGESPLAAAQRELAEEADLTAGRWDLLAEYYSSPGGLTEALRVYLARDLADVPAAQRHTREAEEHGMPTGWVALDVAVDAVLAGRVRNAAIAIGVLSAHVSAGRGWSTLRPADTPWPAHPRLRG